MPASVMSRRAIEALASPFFAPVWFVALAAIRLALRRVLLRPPARPAANFAAPRAFVSEASFRCSATPRSCAGRADRRRLRHYFWCRSLPAGYTSRRAVVLLSASPPCSVSRLTTTGGWSGAGLGHLVAGLCRSLRAVPSIAPAAIVISCRSDCWVHLTTAGALSPSPRQPPISSAPGPRVHRAAAAAARPGDAMTRAEASAASGPRCKA